MPSRRTTSIIWLLTILLALAAMFVMIGINPTSEGILLAVAVGVLVVILGGAYQFAYDRRRGDRGSD